jgi:hypothetical protein
VLIWEVAPPGILEERRDGASPMVRTIGRLSMSPVGRTRTHLCGSFRRSPPMLLREQVARFLDGVTAALIPLGIQVDRSLHGHLSLGDLILRRQAR